MLYSRIHYWNIIEYKGGECSQDDLSCAKNLENYIRLMGGEVAREIYRVLKPGGYAAVLIGDTRMHRHYVHIAQGPRGGIPKRGLHT